MNAETKSYGSLIKGDSIFRVPIFQRNYSWEKKNWEDLWLDIKEGKRANKKHYMGSVVVVDKGKKNYDLIDGQQRLTTLSLIILSIISLLKSLIDKGIEEEKNTKRIDILTGDFVGKKSLDTLLCNNKLHLNELNEPFYSTYLVQFLTPNNLKKLESSNRLLYDCYQFFYEKINNTIYNEKNIKNILNFIEYLSENLVFIQITAANDLSAYLIFETLNDRGLDLSITDLLKNYLFSRVNETEHHQVKHKWNEILQYVSYKNFPKFLRYVWNSRNPAVTEKELFQVLKRKLKTPTDAIDLLTDLCHFAPVYSALNNEFDNLWDDAFDARKSVSELSLYKVTQCYPLLLAAYHSLEKQEWIKIFRYCSIISFRYNVICQNNPNALEDIYNKAALKITSGKQRTAKEVFSDLKAIYISDDQFKASFKTRRISTQRNTKLVKYIMYNIENHLDNNTLDYLSDSGTIEHILPENPSDEWKHFFIKEQQAEYIYRLGNYTLLEKKPNTDIGNQLYDKKLPLYKKSRYFLSKNIKAKEWTPHSLIARQSFLAEQASALWRINS